MMFCTPKILFDDEALCVVPNTLFLRMYEDDDRRDFYFELYCTEENCNFVDDHLRSPLLSKIHMLHDQTTGIFMKDCKIETVKPGTEGILKIKIRGKCPDKVGEKHFNFENINMVVIMKRKENI